MLFYVGASDSPSVVAADEVESMFLSLYLTSLEIQEVVLDSTLHSLSHLCSHSYRLFLLGAFLTSERNSHMDT